MDEGKTATIDVVIVAKFLAQVSRMRQLQQSVENGDRHIWERMKEAEAEVDRELNFLRSVLRKAAL
jgi:hypothetical protein